MEVPAQHRQQIHPGMRLLLQQHRDVLPLHLNTLRFFQGDGRGLVRRLIQHGSEAEELARIRLGYDHFLLVVVHRSHPHFARRQHVRLGPRIAHFVNALARRERLQFHLSGQHGQFFIV